MLPCFGGNPSLGDPACTSFELDACDRCDSTDSCSAQPCPGLIRSDLTWSCSQPAPPAGWTCVDGAYGDTQYCNCGCGVQDPDCRTTDPAECEICRCGGTSCADTLDPDDSTQCKPPPVDWICSEAAYRDYYCSCGCEAPDPACNGENGSGACSDFPVEGCSGGNASHIAANRNAFCSISPPNEWTCSPAYYQDDLCDCGCGALDPDCTSAKASTCEKCNDEGSCSADDCPGSILANDNAHCSN